MQAMRRRAAAARARAAARDSNGSFGAGLYSELECAELPDAARLASLGCGNPTAVADLRAGEIVLDLGSGGGIDVLLSARRVGALGKAYGLDMTDEMLDARAAQRRRGGRAQRRVPEGPDRGDPAAGCERRRRDLQLRDQPLDRQARRLRGDLPRPAAGRSHRGQRRRRRGSPRTGRARRPRELRRLHRGRALPGRVRVDAA